MGKIPVKQLAKAMGMSERDLLFKLKGIGVSVDEKNPYIETESVQALLQGKAGGQQPREVILRDQEAQQQAAAAKPKVVRRMPTPPPRAPRRRSAIVQKADTRIKTIPTKAKPAPQVEETPAAAEDTATPTATPETPVAAEAPPVETAAAEETAKPRKRRKVSSSGELKPQPPVDPVPLSEGMTVREFAAKLGVRAKDLLSHLVGRGVMATINQTVDLELAAEIVEELGLEHQHLTFEEEVQRKIEALDAETEEDLEARAPVITIMGHVDHGKTTLLDAIRSSKVVEGEHGGITQHIGAYEIDYNGKKLVFLDTPGHEAFTRMRARGAQATDIVVLVVAADDGVMPQTQEAIDHARAADVPIVVALNKIDKNNANPDRVKQGLSDAGLVVEDWGGDIVCVPMAAVKGEGIDDLLEILVLTSELLELQANPGKPAQGVVLEARKETGRGNVGTVLVQDGTLKTSDIFVSGAIWGRVRSLTDDLGNRRKQVDPATPIEITGFNGVPEAGDPFQVVGDEVQARSIVDLRQQELRESELAPAASKASLDQLFARMQSGEVHELPIVLRTDVRGSAEVLVDTLAKLSTDKVQVKVIRSGVGAITTNDVILASASNAIVIGFNVRPEKNARELADKEGVEIRLHRVIYELNDEIKNAMLGLLGPTYEEKLLGQAEVRELFKVPKVGQIAGCHVIEGKILRNAQVRLIRDNVVIHEGKIGTLRRFKDDAPEVRAGFDCGIRLESFQDFKPNDIIEAYAREEVAPTL